MYTGCTKTLKVNLSIDLNIWMKKETMAKKEIQAGDIHEEVVPKGGSVLWILIIWCRLTDNIQQTMFLKPVCLLLLEIQVFFLH